MITFVYARRVGQYDVESSTTAWDMRAGGPSGGTVNTMITNFEKVPPEKVKESGIDYNLSPGMSSAASC